MGSTPAARRAGIHAATSATVAIKRGTRQNVIGSSALTSKRKLCSVRLSARVLARPMPQPAVARKRLCRTTLSTICQRCAPRASLSPISRVRQLTIYEIKLYTPTAPMTNARPPKPSSRTASARGAATEDATTSFNVRTRVTGTSESMLETARRRPAAVSAGVAGPRSSAKSTG